MDSSWKSQWYPAPLALDGVLAGIWSVQAMDTVELAARVLPDGSTCLTFLRDQTVLRFADHHDPWSAACISGPRSGAFDFQLSTGGQMLIVQLRPAGARPVLGVPMNGLADQVEPLEAVVGRVSTRITDCVLGDADDVRCVRAIEQWLTQRMRRQPERSERISAVVQEVAGQIDRLPVDELARHVDLSRRHLSRIMHERIGFSTKFFARLTRFDRAVQRSRVLPAAPWAQIAQEVGYADQAHLAREFAELGGIRPSQLRSAAAATIW